MRMRTLRIAVGSLVCLALVAGFSTSGAQAPASPVPPQDGGEAPALQVAPLRPRALEPSSYSKGYVPPPMDLSHLNGQRMLSGGVSVQALPSAFDWRDTGKVTSVKNQSTCGSCYSFAALGNIESKLLIDGAGTFDFSENNAKECNWYETNGSGTSCSGGNYLVVANLFSKKGTVLETCDPYVASDVSCKSTCPYQKTLLDWRIINGSTVPDPSVLKQYIYTHGPVFTAIYAGYYDAWDTEFSSYDGSYTLYHPGTETPNHAVLIVGWDDSLTHAGGTGGWIVKNSWGTGWGASGYFKIAYGSASIGTDSSFIYDWQNYDATGGLMYYDEGAMSVAFGYGDTTAWGLAKFIPTSNTNVTRVEFWTPDATTDVDVYVYDDFNGTTLSNKLGEVLNQSFSEAGYHSVPLSSPVPVTSGDDVIAVVKFTTDSYTYPVPIDDEGPSETGRTYVSHSGSSWADVGVSHGVDVAIRLRTSGSSASDLDPFAYLPMIARLYPPIPDTPVLNAISNSDGDGNYTVDWEAADLADTYTLQEDDNSSFSSPATRYTGSGTSWNASGKPIDKYYYRVRANNSWGSSNWSDVRSVSVTTQPSGPNPGFWKGATDPVEFYVTSDRAYVDDFAITISVPACGISKLKITRTSKVHISNDKFSFSGSFYASGTFNSAKSATGTTGLNNLYIPGCGYINGGPWSWSATWQHSSQATSGAETVEPTVAAGSVYTATLVE